jgi:hypothetical protein
MFIWKEIVEGVSVTDYISIDITVAGPIGHLGTLKIRLADSTHVDLT